MPKQRFQYAMVEDIKVRLSSEEKMALLAGAQTRGVSISEFVRTAATEAARRVVDGHEPIDD